MAAESRLEWKSRRPSVSSDQALIASLTKTLRSMQMTQQRQETRGDGRNGTRRCMVPSTKDDDVSTLEYALLQAEYQQSQRHVARLERQVMDLKEKMRQREIKHMISLKQMKEQLDRLYHQSSINNNKSHSVPSSSLNWSAWVPHWNRENTLLRGGLSKLTEEEDTQSDCSSTDCSSTHGSEAPSSTLVEN